MIETTTSISANGSSGATCNVTGPYFCGSHPTVVLFVSKGAKFPNCPESKSKKGHTTTWSVMNDATASAPMEAGKIDVNVT